MHLAAALAISLFVYLDSWPVGQFMLGRPVLLLPLLGLLVGEPLLGLWLGLVLELITLRSLPMGSALPPDPALAGAWTLLGISRATGLAQGNAQGAPHWTPVLLALLIALPLCWAAPWLTWAQRRINGALWRPRFLLAAEAGDVRACGRAMGATFTQTLLLGALASLAAILVVEHAAPLLEPLALRLSGHRLAGLLPLPWALLAFSLGGLWRHAAGRGGNHRLWMGLALGTVLALLMAVRP